MKKNGIFGGLCLFALITALAFTGCDTGNDPTPVSGGDPPPDTTISYYVSQTGDNTKDGLSSPNALATPVAALTKIAAAYADTTTPWPGKAAGTPHTAVIIVSGTITDTTGAGSSGWLDISGANAYPPITLQGAAGGGTLNAASASPRKRVLNIGNGNKVTLGANLTLTGGSPIGDGGGVYVNDTGTTFTMNGGTISGNTGTGGGGVFVNNGTFTMNGGTISGNTASGAINGMGGGVTVYIGTFIMNDGTISGNTVSGSSNSTGGGVQVHNSATFTKTGGTIYGGPGAAPANTATSGSGGFYGHAVFWNRTSGGKKKVDGDVTGNLSTTDDTNPLWQAGE